MNKNQKCLLTILLCMMALIFFIAVADAKAGANNITARSAIIIDPQDNNTVIYGKNLHHMQPPASTQKLIAAMIFVERLRGDDNITISKNAAHTPSIAPHLKEGEQYTVHALLCLVLERSINGAAVALAEAVAGSEEAFVVLMNDKATRLGLKDTKFINASGLPGYGQYTNVADLALLAKEALKYPLIREVITTKNNQITTINNNRTLSLINTNRLLQEDKTNNFLGGKTGYTNAAKHCLVFGFMIGNDPVIIAILGSSSRHELWQDAKNLIKIASQKLKKPEAQVYASN